MPNPAEHVNPFPRISPREAASFSLCAESGGESLRVALDAQREHFQGFLLWKRPSLLLALGAHQRGNAFFQQRELPFAGAAP